MHKPLIVIELNELNFDLARHYVDKYNDLPAFKFLLSQYDSIITYGEDRYEELEPWIQWVSAHTGKIYAEHGVFRLGEIVSSGSGNLEQIFEVMERRGLRVGAISPMNASNKLKHPAYFIPDPWTNDKTDDSTFSNRVSKMLKQVVNDNAQGKISTSSLVIILQAILKTFKVKETILLFYSILKARGKPWLKALVLDQLIHLIHIYYFRSKSPNISFVFFNAGAHIQHHYLFNSEAVKTSTLNPEWYIPKRIDPFREALNVYDRILGYYINLNKNRACRLLIATGLTQIPYDRLKFYYRLKNHSKFLHSLGINFISVLPLMTRDFHIIFKSHSEALKAYTLLKSAVMARDKNRIFGEIDLKQNSIFASLTYPNEIFPEDEALIEQALYPNFGGEVAFVAIKNGMHSGRGFVFASNDCNLDHMKNEPQHVSKIFSMVQGCF